MTDWILTLPQTESWERYMDECKAVANRKFVMNYRVRFFPEEMRTGDRCFVVHKGKVRGWMEIVGLTDVLKSWTCTTTGREWPPGHYLQRSGPFHEIEDGPDMTGFRGVRRFDGSVL